MVLENSKTIKWDWKLSAHVCHALQIVLNDSSFYLYSWILWNWWHSCCIYVFNFTRNNSMFFCRCASVPSGTFSFFADSLLIFLFVMILIVFHCDSIIITANKVLHYYFSSNIFIEFLIWSHKQENTSGKKAKWCKEKNTSTQKEKMSYNLFVR